MNNTKKVLEITGSLIYPITVGESAFIHEAEGIRRTSTVLSMESLRCALKRGIRSICCICLQEWRRVRYEQ